MVKLVSIFGIEWLIVIHFLFYPHFGFKIKLSLITSKIHVLFCLALKLSSAANTKIGNWIKLGKKNENIYRLFTNKAYLK